MKSHSSLFVIGAIIALYVILASVPATSCPGGRELCGDKDVLFGAPQQKAAGMAEDGWEKFPGNPVFGNGAEGEWDAGGVTCFVVRHFPWGYRMFYSCGGNYASGFGLATSDDGINWERHPDNPVMVPDSGVTVWGPEVLHDGERYHIWYVSRGPNMDGISHATSEDGVSWAPSEHNPVIDHGGCHAVIWDGERYRMFIQHSSGRQHGFEMQFSDDGENWTNQGFVFRSGPTGTWDEITAAPSVAYYEGKLQFWYTGADTVGNRRGEIAIGHAVSDDWGASFDVPQDRTELRQLRPTEQWEGRGLYSSGVDFDGERVYVWYAATGANGGFGYASREINRVTPPPPDGGVGGAKLWSVSPNPSAGYVQINYLGTLAAPATIRLYDAAGRLAHTAQFSPNEPMRLDPSALGLPVGQYVIAVEVKGRAVHQRVAVVR